MLRPGDEFKTEDRCGRRMRCVYLRELRGAGCFCYLVQIVSGTDPGGFAVAPRRQTVEAEWFRQRGHDAPTEI